MKRFLICIMCFLIPFKLFGLDMLLGISYVLDTQGGFYYSDSQGMKSLGLPLINMVHLSEENDTCTLYYRMGEDAKTELVTIKDYQEHSLIHSTLTVKSNDFGLITFHVGDTVVIDELSAAIASYSLVRDDISYAIVGAIALEDLQETEEQKTEFHDTVDKVLNEFRQKMER